MKHGHLAVRPAGILSGVATSAGPSTISCGWPNGRASSMPPPIDPASYESSRGQRPAVTSPIKMEPREHDPYAALREGNRVLATIATILERHTPAFHFDDVSIPLIYLLLFIGGTARTFSWAARSSFFPTLVSRDSFANAVTWNNSVFQIGSVVGPAISGLLVAHIGFPFVYVLDALCAFLFFVLVLPIRRSTQSRNQIEKSTWKSLIAGLRFVLSKKVILATITLDLFAVLLGGATALLPIFADQILHCGPIGLGWMRAAPAVGAFAMALLVAHAPPMKRAGKTLLWCVTGFGIATILFGLSKALWLSLAMLFVAGAVD